MSIMCGENRLAISGIFSGWFFFNCWIIWRKTECPWGLKGGWRVCRSWGSMGVMCGILGHVAAGGCVRGANLA